MYERNRKRDKKEMDEKMIGEIRKASNYHNCLVKIAILTLLVFGHLFIIGITCRYDNDMALKTKIDY